MNWFLNLKLSKKLISTFVVVAVIGAVIGYFGIVSVKNLDENDDILYFRDVVPLNIFSSVEGDVQILRNELLLAMYAKTEIERSEHQKKANQTKEEISKQLSGIEKYIIAPDIKKAYEKDVEARKIYYEAMGDLENFIKQNKINDAIALWNGRFDAKYVEYKNTMDDLEELFVTKAKERVDDNTAEASSATNFILGITAFAFLSSIGLGYFISRIIAKPVTEVVNNIENADLNSQFNSARKDEIGDLQRSFDKFVVSIKETLLQVSEASSALASASTEISSSTEQMAAGAQEQSSQAGEVATAVEEMTKTISENSKNANDTAGTAKRAKEAAEAGGNIVKETVQGMNDIAKVVNKSAETVKALGTSSDQIGEIISVIDDIADQTNLLALNAAIEAARAGEQGRGFAVVADEVRKLAERTTKATKEIASMIKQIQEDTKGAVQSMNEGTQKVNDGIALADKAGDSLREIVGVSQQLTDMVMQIAAASEQQSSAAEQISKNVEAISTVTQQSASGTQQIAHTAEDLNRLTVNLQELLSKFNLGGAEYKGSQPVKKTQKSFAPKSRKAVSENGHLVENY